MAEIFNYSPFHKTLPKCSSQMHWISVRFYEMGDLIKILFLVEFRLDDVLEVLMVRTSYTSFKIFYLEPWGWIFRGTANTIRFSTMNNLSQEVLIFEVGLCLLRKIKNDWDFLKRKNIHRNIQNFFKGIFLNFLKITRYFLTYYFFFTTRYFCITKSSV